MFLTPFLCLLTPFLCLLTLKAHVEIFGSSISLSKFTSINLAFRMLVFYRNRQRRKERLLRSIDVQSGL